MRIFISHSTSKKDDDGFQRLRAVESALKAKPHSHDVLLDSVRLAASFEWRRELDEWMAISHAGVLLLTPKALESPWVLKEATILAHRAALDKRFLLFPALLDGLTRDELKASRFSPLYLDAIQRVPGTQAQQIVDAVVQELAKFGTPPKTRVDLLVDTLARHLKTAAEDDGLEAVCERLTGVPMAWDSSKTRAIGAARGVALAIVTGELGGYGSLRDVMNDLLNAGLSSDAAGRVLNLAGPRWVHPEAAAHLAEVAARNETEQRDEQGRIVSWSVAINGTYLPTFTAPQYVRRAYVPDAATFINLDGGEGDLRLEELVARLRNEARTSPTLKGMNDAKLDSYLASLKTPHFVLLPPPFPDAELLEALQTRYPKLTFIGQERAEEIAARKFKGRVVPLVPPLEPAAESDALVEIEAARQRIDAG